MYIRYLFCSFKRSNTLSLKVQTKFPRIHFLCPSCLQTQQKLENKIHEYKAHIPYVLDMIIISQPTISNLHSQSYGGLIGPAPGHVSDGVPSPSQQQQGQVPLLHVLHTLPVTCNHNNCVSFVSFSNKFPTV